MRLHPEIVLLLGAAIGESIHLYFGLLASSTEFNKDITNMFINISKECNSPYTDETQQPLQNTRKKDSFINLFAF